jgi:hypothetical protein
VGIYDKIFSPLTNNFPNFDIIICPKEEFDSVFELSHNPS